jgi:hypothetical protein
MRRIEVELDQLLHLPFQQAFQQEPLRTGRETREGVSQTLARF